MTLAADFQIQGVEDLVRLRPSPTNPRKHFPKDEIEALAESFGTAGMLTPLLVRPVPAEGKAVSFSKGKWTGLDYFEVVDGERRFRAAGEAGLAQVPVIVRNLSDQQVRLIQLITFAQRADLKPSEEAAAYHALASAGRTAEQIAAEVSKPLGFVRSLLRLGKLPEWAMRAVDAGILPRATAELVSRVPGEASRARAAACVLLDVDHPAMLDSQRWNGDEWVEAAVAIASGKRAGDLLSYRDTRILLQQHFTRELKSAPFDRKSLTLLPVAGSCEACPSRAGNDPEATAEGVRADQCLNPDCYRAKEDAYREFIANSAAEKNILPANLDTEGFDKPPRGWCRPDVPITDTELNADFAGYQGDTLAKKLGKNLPQKYFAWGRNGKVVYLMKTAEVKRALVTAGVLKTEPRKKAGPPALAPKPATGPTSEQITARAVVIGAKILAEYGAEQFEELEGLEDAAPRYPVHDGLRFIAEFLIRDHRSYGQGRVEAIRDVFECDVEDAAGKLAEMKPQQLLATCLRLVAYPVLDHSHDRDGLLEWAELDWDQLKGQAERELTTGETVDEKIAKAETATELPIKKKG